MKIVKEIFNKGKVNRVERFLSTEEYQRININEVIEETKAVARDLAWAVTILDNGDKKVFYKTNKG